MLVQPRGERGQIREFRHGKQRRLISFPSLGEKVLSLEREILCVAANHDVARDAERMKRFSMFPLISRRMAVSLRFEMKRRGGHDRQRSLCIWGCRCRTRRVGKPACCAAERAAVGGMDAQAAERRGSENYIITQHDTTRARLNRETRRIDDRPVAVPFAWTMSLPRSCTELPP